MLCNAMICTLCQPMPCHATLCPQGGADDRDKRALPCHDMHAVPTHAMLCPQGGAQDRDKRAVPCHDMHAVPTHAMLCPQGDAEDRDKLRKKAAADKRRKEAEARADMMWDDMAIMARDVSALGMLGVLCLLGVILAWASRPAPQDLEGPAVLGLGSGYAALSALRCAAWLLCSAAAADPAWLAARRQPRTAWLPAGQVVERSSVPCLELAKTGSMDNGTAGSLKQAGHGHEQDVQILANLNHSLANITQAHVQGMSVDANFNKFPCDSCCTYLLTNCSMIRPLHMRAGHERGHYLQQIPRHRRGSGGG
jgi:hypothetical protein